jgi:hypothetical protein
MLHVQPTKKYVSVKKANWFLGLIDPDCKKYARKR